MLTVKLIRSFLALLISYRSLSLVIINCRTRGACSAPPFRIVLFRFGSEQAGRLARGDCRPRVPCCNARHARHGRSFGPPGLQFESPDRMEISRPLHSPSFSCFSTAYPLFYASSRGWLISPACASAGKIIGGLFSLWEVAFDDVLQLERS